MNPERVFRKHHASLLRYLYVLTGDETEAADLAQETFVRFLESPGRKRNPRAWLFTVATNLVRERARTEKTRSDLIAGHIPASGPDRPDVEYARREAIERVREALSHLSPRDRQVLLMREEGFTYREIADAVGVARNSVGVFIGRALDRLADLYQEAPRGSSRGESPEEGTQDDSSRGAGER